eukprot:15452097-Alexandrium_andersonii.AAC.1
MCGAGRAQSKWRAGAWPKANECRQGACIASPAMGQNAGSSWARRSLGSRPRYRRGRSDSAETP